jgi:hypothetical protein
MGMTALSYLVFRGHLNERIALSVLLLALCALPIGRICRRHGVLARKLGKATRWNLSAAGRRGVGESLVFLLAFAVTACLAVGRGIPLPYVHDEFSYLLAADTFAHGRLTNPTPPAAEHFESMHILVRPTYQSKYPPGQGLAMALGQVIVGHPIWGVWLSTALAAAAMCWMLRAFVPPHWALLGGVLTAMHPQMLEWGQRYWGGSVAVLGGALLMGGVGRLMRRPGAAAAMWAAAGVLIVGNTRPFEGLVLSIVAGVGLMAWLVRRRALTTTLRIALAPALLVLIPGAAWMGWYNWRVTGNALRLPYQEHHAQYGRAPLFLFQSLPPPKHYNHPELERFAGDQMPDYQRRDSWRAIVTFAWEKVIWGLALTCFGNVSVLAVPLAALPWLVWRVPHLRWLCVMLVAFVLPLLAETYMYGHYAAPAAGLAAAIVMMCMRRLRRLWPRIGRQMAVVASGAAALWFALTYGWYLPVAAAWLAVVGLCMGRAAWAALSATGPYLLRAVVALTLLWSVFWWIGFNGWKQGGGFASQRMQIIEDLSGRPGRHLVIVRYAPDHNVHDEWVYNGADIPGAKVLLARDMGEQRNRRLIEAFAGRHVWLLEPHLGELKRIE